MLFSRSGPQYAAQSPEQVQQLAAPIALYQPGRPNVNDGRDSIPSSVAG